MVRFELTIDARFELAAYSILLHLHYLILILFHNRSCKKYKIGFIAISNMPTIEANVKFFVNKNINAIVTKKPNSLYDNVLQILLVILSFIEYVLKVAETGGIEPQAFQPQLGSNQWQSPSCICF